MHSQHVRKIPLLSTEDENISIVIQPATHRTLGFFAFAAMKHGPTTAPLNASQGIKAGMNSAGLSCDKQSLSETVFPAFNPTATNIDGALFCKWCLEHFQNVSALKIRLASGTINFVQPQYNADDFGNGHFALRDAVGESVVVEFIKGTMQVYDDGNDAGVTGFGVMTNSPTYPWQVENMQFRQWKMKKYQTQVAIDGSWYPDARFERIVLVKSKMLKPKSLKEAVAQVLHVLNTISVPPGTQAGKDMDAASDDHRTQFAVIYDHKNGAIYWRSVLNQNLARLQFSDVNISVGAKQQILLVESSKLKWFQDASLLL